MEETDDGLVGEEGAFAICSFWLVSAHVIRAERVLARDQPLLQVVRSEPAANAPTPAMGGQIDDHG